MEYQSRPLARAAAFLRSCFQWDKTFVRHILFLAAPMVLQELVAASLHIIDGMMVSGLGDAAYSGVIQANRFTFVFQLFIFGATSGSAIFLSQYWGARDVRRMRHAMGIGLTASLLLAIPFSLAGLLFPRQIIACFLQPGDSFELAVSYLRIIAPGYLLIAVNYMYAATLKAAEKTYIPMMAGLAGIATNTVFNYLLIYGKLRLPALGVEGAAIATVFSSFVTLAVNVSFSYAKRLPAGAKLHELICRDRAFIRKFIKTVLPVIFNEGLWGLGTTMYSVFYGAMGVVNVAAVGVCNTVGDLLWVFVFGITGASAIVVGKALGMGDREQAYLYAKRLMAGATLLGLALGTMMLSLRTPMVGLFTGLSQAARDRAHLLLLLNAAFLWIRAFNCVNVVGVLRSGGDTVFSLVLDAGSLWLLAVPAAGVAALALGWPIEYVYCCTCLDEVLKLFVGIPHFKKKKWMNILTEAKEAVPLGSN